jgi:hypothetical protein
MFEKCDMFVSRRHQPAPTPLRLMPTFPTKHNK